MRLMIELHICKASKNKSEQPTYENAIELNVRKYEVFSNSGPHRLPTLSRASGEPKKYLDRFRFLTAFQKADTL